MRIFKSLLFGILGGLIIVMFLSPAFKIFHTCSLICPKRFLYKKVKKGVLEWVF